MYILSLSYWSTGYFLQHVQNSSPQPHFHCVCDDDAQRWRTASKAVSQNHNRDCRGPTSIPSSSPCWRLLVCCGPLADFSPLIPLGRDSKCISAHCSLTCRYDDDEDQRCMDEACSSRSCTYYTSRFEQLSQSVKI